MPVSTMQAVNIIGFMDEIDDVITVLGESGVFHPDDVSVFTTIPKAFHIFRPKIFMPNISLTSRLH